jgi:D-lactate dehydrogenase (cytochrome)
VSAEHGIGKLKTELLRQMYGDDGVEEIRRVIKVFNPDGRLNRGNVVGLE